MRDIGTEGQRYFGVLCSHVGLVANQSLEKDATGWDFLVEFPLSEKRSKSLDELPSPIECKVQVKSTKNKDKKIQVKVSVMYRLVKTQLPAFMLFFEYGKSHDPEGAYLLHIGEELIGRVLKRVRELEAKGKGNALHKSTLTLHYSEKNKLKEVTGQSLKEAIESYLPEGLNNYIKCKLKLHEELGFEELTHKANVTFTSKDNLVQDELIDLFIGVRPEIDVSKFELFSSRFGIELPVDEVSDLGSGKLSLPDMKPSFDGVLYFKEDKYGVPIEFNADFYTPPAELNIPQDKLKFRAISDMFVLVYKPGALDFKFKDIDNSGEPLDAFFKRVWFLDKLAKGQKLIFGFERDGKSYDVGDLNTFSEPVEDVSEILSLSVKSTQICERLLIKPEKVMVNFERLMEYAKGIKHLHTVMFPQGDAFRWVIPSDHETKKEDLFNVAMIIGGRTTVGTACIAYCYAVMFDPQYVKESEEGLEAFSDKTRLGPVKYGTFEDIAELNVEDMKKDFARVLESEGKNAVLYEQ